MDQVTLEIPISKSLKQKAEKIARDQGVSLTKMMQQFISNLTKSDIRSVNYQEPSVQLGPKAIKRYNKIIDEIHQGIGIVKTKNTDDFLQKLRS